jgi:opacity protein-like surface antigen
MKTKHLTVIATMCFGGLLLVSTAAQAQTWSSAASVCQPGTDSAGLYTFSAAAFEFTGTKTGLIRTRCAVTNPLDLGVPGWKTLVVGYQDPDGTGVNYQVNAQLNRVSKSTGTNYILAVFDSSSFAVTTATSRSISFTHTFYQGTRPSSLKYPPVGPSAPMVAYSMAATAPCAAVRGPLLPLMSVAQ